MTVFAMHGYRNGSTTQIAAVAGVSPAQIFYYFPTKEAVLEAVLDRRDHLADEVAGPATQRPARNPARDPEDCREQRVDARIHQPLLTLGR